FYEEELDSRAIRGSIVRFAEWLIAKCEVREVVTAEDAPLRGVDAWRALYRSAANGVVLQRFLAQEDEPYSPLARLSVLRAKDSEFLEWTSNLCRPFHILLCPM